jgi:hypothetical protein
MENAKREVAGIRWCTVRMQTPRFLATSRGQTPRASAVVAESVLLTVVRRLFTLTGILQCATREAYFES